MRRIIQHLQNLDWILGGLAILLTGIGLLSLYSSSGGQGDFSNFEKQLAFLGVGVLLMGTVSLFDWRLLKNNSILILLLYVLGALALGGLFFFAPEIRGVKGWYKLGELSVDPIEYVKVVLVLLIAKYFSGRHIEIYRMRHIFTSGLYFAFPIALIFLQPDLGAAALLVIIWLVLLLVAGIKVRHLLGILALGLLTFALGWTAFLQDYQKERIFAFIEPELDPLGIGWSQLQAKIAIGNGGLFGQGLGQGTQTQYGFLSEPQTDFIFAALAEEFGLVGILVLFALFLWLVARVLRIGLNAQGNFPRLFATGFATLLIVQVLVNVGMNLGLLPIVGLPLPFVSYGGSSLLMSYVALGILQSIKTH